MHTIVRDVGFALRLLGRSPGFTAVVLLTLALGLGATTAIFSAVYAVLLKPLPHADGDRLLVIRDVQGGDEVRHVSYPEFRDWEELSGSGPFERVAAFFNWSATLTGGTEPANLRGVRASASLLPLLGVNPILGRGFTAAEELVGAEQVVLIGESLWHRRFGGDPAIVGRAITLNDRPYTVIGVLPGWFGGVRPSDTSGGRPCDLFAPLQLEEETSPRGLHFLAALARLRPGDSLEQARSGMAAAVTRLQQDRGTTHGAVLLPFRTTLVAGSRQVLLALLTAVAFVLLITCANLANMLLARSSARRQEMAIRLAIGANRGRLVQQLLTESVVLGLAGGALGVFVAWIAVRATAGSEVLRDAGSYGIELDWWVLAFAAVVSLTVGVLFGLAPALEAGHAPGASGLREGPRETGGQRQRLRSALIVSEVALAVLLLVGAGLLVRSFANLLMVPRGFTTDRVSTFFLSTSARYADTDARRRFFESVIERLQGSPGIDAVAVINELPLGGGGVNGSTPIEGIDTPPDNTPNAEKRMVSADYFRVMNIPLRRGRTFTDRDDERSAPVMIVSESFVRRYLGDGDPLGRRAAFSWDMEGYQEIVGVVSDVKHYGLDDEPLPMVYVSYKQRPSSFFSLVLTSDLDRAALASTIREAVRSIDPDRPIERIYSMDEVVAESVGSRRFAMLIVTGFAGLGLLLALTGIYGVLTYVVRQRTREIGLRVALGASPAVVLRLVLQQALTLTAFGLVIGLAGAVLLGRLIAHLLFELTPTDPATLLAVAAGLGSVALVASLVPAIRALKVDPVTALRVD